MGGKASNFMQSDRPESGGADRDGERENSGLLERDKERFAQEEQEKRADAPEQQEARRDQFSVGSPRNPDK